MTTKTDEELAWAYIKGQKAIDAFDKREANAQLRCIALGRELERHKAKRFLPISEPATNVVDGEFSEAAE
jgi:hypothetical protein